MEQYQLPDGWVWTTVGDIYKVIGGGTPSTKVEEYWEGDIPWITSADIYGLKDIRPRKKISELGIKDSATNLVPTGSLIVVTRVGLGKVALTNTPLCFSQDSQALIGDDAYILPEYALYYLSRATLTFKYKSRGTTIEGVTKQQLKVLPFPLPPLAEQQRIAARVEQLLAQRNTARAALDTLPPLLKKVRQRILADAFAGRLTRRCPTDEPASVLLERIQAERNRRSKAKYEAPALPDVSDLPELPEGWVWVTLENLLIKLQYGTSVKADALAEQGIPILRMGNIQESRLDFNNLKYIHPEKENIEKYRLEKGDILINRTNSPELVGKAALFESNDLFVFASYLIKLVVDANLTLPGYVVNFINSHLGRAHVNRVKHQVAGQANINSANIQEMPIPLPPLEEQQRIVAHIKNLFAQVEAIEAAVGVARRRVEQAEQAVLSRAFRGELVAQDPNDEPAAALLERIKTGSGVQN